MVSGSNAASMADVQEGKLSFEEIEKIDSVRLHRMTFEIFDSNAPDTEDMNEDQKRPLDKTKDQMFV